MKCYIRGKVQTRTSLSVIVTLASLSVSPPAIAQFPGEDMMAELAMPGQEKKLALRFYDAVDGKPIRGGIVALDDTQGITDARGRVELPFPDVRPDEDMKIVRFRKKGYIPADIKVRFMVGTIFLNRFSISKKLAPGKLRVVLDWSSKPQDLDAHLVSKNRYHISFRKMKNYRDIAKLDRDDVDGEGPETITIEKVNSNAEYKYFVHDYTNRQNKSSRALGKSRAQVHIYDSKRLLHTVTAPESSGISWHAFTFKKGEFHFPNQLSGAYPK
jgi:hypothetical protein